MTRGRRLAAPVLLSSLMTGSASAQCIPDTVIVNARVHTVDAARPSAEAVATSRNLAPSVTCFGPDASPLTDERQGVAISRWQ